LNFRARDYFALGATKESVEIKAESSMNVDIRPSPIAGLWYEGDPKALARTVDAYLEGAQLPKLEGEVIALVAPHAGHRYSGPVAGYAFAALRGLQPDLVVILSPFHNPHNAPFLTSAHDSYATPLGTIPIDHGSVGSLNVALHAALDFGLTRISNDPEHSLEIELPFLQRVLGSGWKLLPVMVRTQEREISQTLGNVLAKVIRGRNAIMVASTDLSHYFDQQTAMALDHAMLAQIEGFDPEGVFDLEQSGKGYACGLGALTAVMWAARELGADKVKILRHATSGDITGDYNGVVGYGAAAILKTK
jgi:AmmeMemoRadiSam system protein B